MVGLLVAGVTLATEGRLAVGVTLCALAALIKLPAAVAIVFLAVVPFPAATGAGRWAVFVTAVVVPCAGVAAGALGAPLRKATRLAAPPHVPPTHASSSN